MAQRFCTCGRIAVALCDGAKGEGFCNKPICEQHLELIEGHARYCPECAQERKKRQKKVESLQQNLFS